MVRRKTDVATGTEADVAGAAAGDVAAELAGLRHSMDQLTQGLAQMLDTQVTHTQMLIAVLGATTAETEPEEKLIDALGAILAQSLLDGGDAAAAGAAMEQSEAAELPPALRDQRSFTQARIHAAEGRLPVAVAALTTLATPAADELRARLLEQAGDWRGAQAALADLGRKIIPSTGLLDQRMQDVVLRQASTAVQAEDDAALAALRLAYLSRLQPPRLDLFRLLTTAPLSGSQDLPRAGSDVALARAIPQGLQALVAR